MRGPAGVMVGYPLLQMLGRADVFSIWKVMLRMM
jgi:hypothetical protein